MDRRLVEPFDRDMALVGGPPVTGAAIHFLLRDEFRLAEMDRATPAGGERLRGTARERHRP